MKRKAESDLNEAASKVRRIHTDLKMNVVKSLNLGKIEADGLSYINAALKENTSVTSLNFDHNQLGHQGLMTLVDALKENYTVLEINGLKTAQTDLYLKRNQEIQEVVYELVQNLENSISVNFSHRNIGAYLTKHIGQNLKENTSLISLDLSCNAIGDEGAKYISQALETNTTLKRLNLEQNKIGDEGIRVLAESLKKNYTLIDIKSIKNAEIDLYLKRNQEIHFPVLIQYFETSTSISLNDVKINGWCIEDNLEPITKALKLNTTLTSFNFGNAEKVEVLKVMLEALVNNKTLTTLNLHAGKIGLAGLMLILDLKNITTLTSLNLRGNKIGPVGVKFILEAFNKTLTSLDLRSNSIGDEGIIRICKDLETNTILKNLNLSDNKIKASSVNLILESLKNNKTLTKLGLAGGGLDGREPDDPGEYFGLYMPSYRPFDRIREEKITLAGLENNNTLTSLDLSGHNIKDEDVSYMLEALKKNTSLTSLNLAQNNIDVQGTMGLIEVLKENDTLIKIKGINNQEIDSYLLKNRFLKIIRDFDDKGILPEEIIPAPKQCLDDYVTEAYRLYKALPNAQIGVEDNLVAFKGLLEPFNDPMLEQIAHRIIIKLYLSDSISFEDKEENKKIKQFFHLLMLHQYKSQGIDDSIAYHVMNACLGREGFRALQESRQKIVLLSQANLKDLLDNALLICEKEGEESAFLTELGDGCLEQPVVGQTLVQLPSFIKAFKERYPHALYFSCPDYFILEKDNPKQEEACLIAIKEVGFGEANIEVLKNHYALSLSGLNLERSSEKLIRELKELFITQYLVDKEEELNEIFSVSSDTDEKESETIRSSEIKHEDREKENSFVQRVEVLRVPCIPRQIKPSEFFSCLFATQRIHVDTEDRGLEVKNEDDFTLRSSM